MKEKDQKRLMHDLFYGIEGDEDSMSYLDMCLKGDGDFEGLFEVTGNEGQKKIKEIFCRRSGKFYLGLQIDKSSLERLYLKGLEVVNGRNLYDQATKSIANLKKALSFMGKYVDIESGVVKQSGLEIEDVIQKILHDFFKYENNSLSTEDDDSKKVSNYFIKQKYYILIHNS